MFAYYVCVHVNYICRSSISIFFFDLFAFELILFNLVSETEVLRPFYKSVGIA